MNNQEQQNQNQKKEMKKLPGFYIALCCCVLVIGLAGYFTERKSSNNTKISHETANEESVFSGNIDSYTGDAISRNAVPASETVTQEEYAEETANAVSEADEEAVSVYNADYTETTAEEYEINNPDTEAAVIVSAEEPDLEAPVSGNVLESFSDKLVYNSAMSDWRTHDGVDLAADVGCSVHAAANGTVSKIFSDALGEGIEIEHANGVVTRYMGLKSIENLNEGDSVSAGDVIGLVGDSKGENAKESHLHFEVYKDGTAVNPADYM